MSTCGYYVNTSQQLPYGFGTYNLLSSSTSTFTVVWQAPQSGVIFATTSPINVGSAGTFNFPTGASYYYFNNQQTWSVSVDLSTCYVYVIVYNVYAPIYFTLEVDGQTLSISQVISTFETTSCCASIGGYDSVVQLNNGLQLEMLTCSSFGQAGPGTTSIPLGGACTCGGISDCVGCPTSGGATSLTCPVTIPPTITPPPCSLPKFLNLPVLSPPASKSVISSSLWNAIVNNIYSTYNSLVKIKTALSLANYANLLNQAYAIADTLSTPTPYAFTPLITASKGVPLTADDFNALVNALEQVYNELHQPLPHSISPEFPDAIVKSETFTKIVDNLNALRQSALRSVLLTSTYGNELNSLSSDFAGQNVFVCSVSVDATLSGNITIENLLIVQIPSTLTIEGNTSITRLIVQSVSGTLTLQDTANAQSTTVGTLSGTLEVTNFASVQNLFVNEIPSGGQLTLSGNAYVQNLQVNSCQSGSIVIQDYAIVNNLGGMAPQCVSTSGSST